MSRRTPTGLVAINYRLSDDIRDPVQAPDDSHPAETVVRLPDGALSYSPGLDAPLPAPIPKSHTGPITFGSFNEPALLSKAVLGTWARLLQAAPDARLLLTGPGPYRDEATRAWLLENFAKLGVPPEQVEIAPGRGQSGRHLPIYHRVDVALDTFPCNGVAAACDALWMGVPVVALCGDRASARTTASVLTRLGLDEFVTSDEDAYVEAAAALAGDGVKRRGFRRNLAAEDAGLGDVRSGFVRTPTRRCVPRHVAPLVQPRETLAPHKTFSAHAGSRRPTPPTRPPMSIRSRGWPGGGVGRRRLNERGSRCRPCGPTARRHPP